MKLTRPAKPVPGDLVPPQRGPLSRLSRGELAVVDAQFGSVDAMNEADASGPRASKATLSAGQAAVNLLNARWGRT